MEASEIIGYACFVIIGLTLGLIGGGGSILAVPVLIYLLGYSIDQATAYSLFIVGATSLAGSFTCLKKGDFNIEALYLFALPSVISIFLTRHYVVPCIPDKIEITSTFAISKQLLIMSFFSLIVIFSSLSMIRKSVRERKKDLMWKEWNRSPIHIPFIVILGAFVGLLSGVVGVGGGFMIIPVLVVFLRVPMKQAIGTSLAVIAINSSIGFAGSIGTIDINWKFLLIATSLAIAGIFAGSKLTTFIRSNKLKPAFGWFVLCVGIFILTKELFFKSSTKN